MKSSTAQRWGIIFLTRPELVQRRDKIIFPHGAEGPEDFVDGSPHSGSPKVIRFGKSPIYKKPP
jgi:hypothetical protein